MIRACKGDYDINQDRGHNPTLPPQKWIIKEALYNFSWSPLMHKCKECLFTSSKLTAAVFGGKTSTSGDTFDFGSGVKLGVPEGKGLSPYYYFTFLPFKNFTFKISICWWSHYVDILGLPLRKFSQARMKTGQSQRPAREHLVASSTHLRWWPGLWVV